MPAFASTIFLKIRNVCFWSLVITVIWFNPDQSQKVAAYLIDNALSLFRSQSVEASQVESAPPREKPAKRSIEELILTIPAKYGISPLLMAAIVEKESSGQRDAIRFEPGQMNKARNLTKNPELQRMYASSHGYAQIMGWWAPEFHVSWSDLYDPETNIELSCVILRKALDRHAHEQKFDRIRNALAEYNGSTAYADQVLARLGKELIVKNL